MFQKLKLKKKYKKVGDPQKEKCAFLNFEIKNLTKIYMNMYEQLHPTLYTLV